MQISPRQSLRRLLLTHELAFLVLVGVTGLLGGFWAYFWQQTAAESIRLNELAHAAQEIRSDLFRQMKEAIVARLRDDPQALRTFAANSRMVEKRFNELRRESSSRAEDYAIQSMQQAYRVLQRDMRGIFEDSYLLNRVLRIKLLDPNYEQTLLGEFERAFGNFRGLVEQQLSAQQRHVQNWARLAPLLIPLPIAFAVVLLVFSRQRLMQGFVRPMQVILAGTRRISRGDLSGELPEAGVAEIAELARGINDMAGELEKTRNAMVDSERQAALGSLVPVVAHNIRNPLAAIRANAQLLDHLEDAAELRETRDAIIETVDRLGRWVSALVSYLYPLTPQLRTRKAAALWDAAAGLLQGRLAAKHIAIERRPWDSEAKVAVDVDLMEQAFYGLLSNAIDASPEGATIGLRISTGKQHVTMALRDMGSGIPFRPVPSDLRPGPTTKRFGTGLGIPIAFKVCKAHGWELEFHLADGSGTTVVVVAPRVEPEITGDHG